MKKKTKRLMWKALKSMEKEFMDLSLFDLRKNVIHLLFLVVSIAFVKIGLITIPGIKDEGILFISGCCLLFMLYFFGKQFLQTKGFLFLSGLFISIGILFDKPCTISVGGFILLVGFGYWPFYYIRKMKAGEK